MNKIKFIIPFLFIIMALALTNTSRADYSDYVPGVGVVIVKWAGFNEAGEPIANIVDQSGKSIASNVPLNIDQTTGRGTPDYTFANGETILAPTIKQEEYGDLAASIIDNSERRATQFREAYPQTKAQNLVLGYVSDPKEQALAPDSPTSIREVITVALRMSDPGKYRDNPNLAWEEALKRIGGDPSKDKYNLPEGLVNEWLQSVNPNLQATDRNGDGIIQREELFQAVSQSGSQGQTPPSPPQQTPPSSPPPSSPPPSSPPPVAVPSCTFAATRPKILYNQKSKLTWNCVNVTTCSIDQGVGLVSVPSGEKEVEPKNSTIYTLTCSGPGGQIQKTTEVSVFGVYLEETKPE